MHGIANLLVVNGIMETEEQPPHRFAGANRHPSRGGELPFLGPRCAKPDFVESSIS